METGDEEALKIWKWFFDISLEEFKRTYKLMGMEFDHYTGESFYRDKTDDVVKELTDKGYLLNLRVKEEKGNKGKAVEGLLFEFDSEDKYNNNCNHPY